MELRQLEYFVAVVETGSFSRAAERCNITQPSLSQQIIKLEQELGQILFDRLGRTIAITEVGNLFYPRALSILSDVQQAKHAVTDGYAPEERELAVGIIPTLAPYLLAGTVARFKHVYPSAPLKIVEDTTDNLIDALLGAVLDVIFVSLPINNKKIETEELFSEPLLVAMSDEHPLARKATIAADDLADVPFIRLTDQNCLADQLDAFCYLEQIDPPVTYHTSNLMTTMDLIRLGLGISMIPVCSLPSSGHGLCFKIPDHASAKRVIVAARHKGRPQSASAKAFGHFLKDMWEEITSV